MFNMQNQGIVASKVGDDVIECCNPLDVQYACRNWMNHLRQSNIDLCDYDQVYNFIQHHFLHWLEALSLMREMLDTSIHLMQTLAALLSVGNLNP